MKVATSNWGVTLSPPSLTLGHEVRGQNCRTCGHKLATGHCLAIGYNLKTVYSNASGYSLATGNNLAWHSLATGHNLVSGNSQVATGHNLATGHNFDTCSPLQEHMEASKHNICLITPGNWSHLVTDLYTD